MARCYGSEFVLRLLLGKSVLGLRGSGGLGVVCVLAFWAGLQSVMAQSDLPPAIEDRFHIGAKPFAEVRKHWSRSQIAPYEQAFVRFPEIGACSTVVDGRIALNWNDFATDQQVAICLFHLAETLGPPEALVAWFRDRGFTAGILGIFGNWPSDEAPTVHASINLAGADAPKYPGFRGLIARLTEESLSVGVGYNERLVPDSVTVTINWE